MAFVFKKVNDNITVLLAMGDTFKTKKSTNEQPALKYMCNVLEVWGLNPQTPGCEKLTTARLTPPHYPPTPPTSPDPLKG